MAVDGILKNRKIVISQKHLTDFDEGWHCDASQPSGPHQSIKFRDLKNPRWRTAAILKNRKMPHLKNRLTDFEKKLAQQCTSDLMTSSATKFF